MIIINQSIQTTNSFISLSIKREDRIHSFVSGNKFRKLKYNLLEAKKEKHRTIVTFGGAYSNHIAAVAYACQEENIQSIGIIRGEELAFKVKENPTLQFALKCGMKLEFISREKYRTKETDAFLEELKGKYSPFYLVPEGGTNALAIKGCQEILTKDDADFDYICCAVGTGGTIAGIINSANKNQKILGFPALKGDFLTNEINKYANNSNFTLITEYHFGGYAKVNTNLINFVNQFYLNTNIPLDTVYTGKMVYGVMDLIQKKYFPNNSKILMIHTGGLQGNEGMNKQLKQKKMTQLIF
jgi:1-aminocyclopropane-1-carboxylate deaminase